MPTQEPNPKPKPAWLPPMEARQERADHYFKTVLNDQRGWYSKNAGKQKRRYLTYALTVIVLGAVISVFQVFDAAPWVRYVTAILGALVSVIRAVDTLLRPAETWQGYRKASESMKREYRFYLTNADLYADAPDEEAAFRLFVGRVETIIAEEQQLFWQSQGKSPPAKEAPKKAHEGPAGAGSGGVER